MASEEGNICYGKIFLLDHHLFVDLQVPTIDIRAPTGPNSLPAEGFCIQFEGTVRKVLKGGILSLNL